jgi:hypothetical protein
MSEAFQEFLQSCHVRHRVSTTQYAQSNGAAERAVRTLKTLRAKCPTPNELFQAILELQNTPRGPSGLSLADLFLGRRQRTWSSPVPGQGHKNWREHPNAIMKQQNARKGQSGLRGHKSVTLKPGTTALLRDFFGQPAHITIVDYGQAPRSYKVRLPSGVVTERNCSFLFPVPRGPTVALSDLVTSTEGGQTSFPTLLGAGRGQFNTRNSLNSSLRLAADPEVWLVASANPMIQPNQNCATSQAGTGDAANKDRLLIQQRLCRG